MHQLEHWRGWVVSAACVAALFACAGERSQAESDRAEVSAPPAPDGNAGGGVATSDPPVSPPVSEDTPGGGGATGGGAMLPSVPIDDSAPGSGSGTAAAGCTFFCPVTSDRLDPAGVQTHPFVIEAIGQIGFVVDDVQRVGESWWDLFGIGPWATVTTEGLDGGGDPLQVIRAYAYLGDLELELIQVVQGETPHAEFLARHGEGLHHLGVFVADVEAEASNLVAQGADAIMESPGESIFLHSGGPGGVIFELIEQRGKMVATDAPPERSGLSLQSVDHIGLAISSRDAVAASYEQLLGLGPWSRLRLGGGPADPAVADLAFAYAGELELELIEIVEGQTTHTELIDDYGEGLHHLGFFVDDPVAQSTELVAQGAEVILQDSSQSWLYLDTGGPGGVIFELIARRGKIILP